MSGRIDIHAHPHHALGLRDGRRAHSFLTIWRNDAFTLGVSMSGTVAQKALFEAIHDRYTDAITDAYSEAYKDEFMHAVLLEELGSARSLIEIASGVGQASAWLRAQRPSLEIAGCDISEAAAKDFTARHGRPCWVWDMTKPIEPEQTFDIVLVMGGIHHLVADLPTAFRNIHRLLNPGGRLLMSEPNADFILEPVRQLWYRTDRKNFDAENEHALAHGKLLGAHGEGFRLRRLNYVGGPAYFLLLQNWVLRIPKQAKRHIAGPLMAFERMYHRLPGKLPFSTFIASWEKI
jgi:SAM-dependent methyltransferase